VRPPLTATNLGADRGVGDGAVLDPLRAAPTARSVSFCPISRASTSEGPPAGTTILSARLGYLSFSQPRRRRDVESAEQCSVSLLFSVRVDSRFNMLAPADGWIWSVALRRQRSEVRNPLGRANYFNVLVSVLKLLESLESFVIERRQSDSRGAADEAAGKPTEIQS
jgi:hypothetical protein